MDTIPYELQAIIFRLACVDGGTTGCSLALVSKYIRDVSGPYRLRSVSLHGPEEIQSFLISLGQTPEHLRRIRNLFISTQRRNNADARICWKTVEPHLKTVPRVTPGDLKKVPRVPTPGDIKAIGEILERRNMLLITGRSSELWFRKYFQIAVRIWEEDNAHLAAPMAQAIDAILKMVAPTLNVLEMDIKPTVSAYFKGVTDFPRLQELTSHGGYPIMRKDPKDHLIPHCPSLRRLHLHNPHKPHQISYSTVIPCIGAFAPHLTHIFFSNLTSSDQWLSDKELYDLPKTISHTYINYAYSNYTASERSAGLVEAPMEMEDTIDAPEHNRVIVLPDQQNGYDYGSPFFCWPVSESQWLSRISGHAGCWPDEESGNEVPSYAVP